MAGTQQSGRRPLIAGNWKMHLTHLEAIGLVQKIVFSLKPAELDAAEVVVVPPFTALRSVQTLAMKTWRIRLVNPDGAPLTFKQAVLRFFLALLGLLLAGAGFWWAWFDRDRQFLHDRIVGTRLVRMPRKTGA